MFDEGGTRVAEFFQHDAEPIVSVGQRLLPFAVVRIELDEGLPYALTQYQFVARPLVVALGLEDCGEAAVRVAQFEDPVRIVRGALDQTLRSVAIDVEVPHRAVEIPLQPQRVSGVEMTRAEAELPFGVLRIARRDIGDQPDRLVKRDGRRFEIALRLLHLAELVHRLRSTIDFLVRHRR